MRRTCERPGCGEPVAVVYGQEAAPPESGGAQQFWIDAWSPERSDEIPPVGTRGVLCALHGELLQPPRGWTLIDRRDAVPRLFKPQLVRDPSAPMGRPQDGSGAIRRRAVRDGTGRRRASDVPRPQLFVDIERRAAEVAVDVAVSIEIANDASGGGPIGVSAADVGQTPTETRLDDEMSPASDELADVSGPMLRDAFRRAAIGKRDATRELLRPTSVPPSADRDPR